MELIWMVENPIATFLLVLYAVIGVAWFPTYLYLLGGLVAFRHLVEDTGDTPEMYVFLPVSAALAWPFAMLAAYDEIQNRKS